MTNKNEKKCTVREAAYHSLWKCHASGGYSNIEIDAALKRHNFEERDRALFTNIVYGTIERRITVDYIIGQLSSIALNEIDPRVLIIIEMGLYQCLFLDRIPDHAAVNECVELSRKFAKQNSASFVNAILRRALREGDSVKYPDRKISPDLYLSVKYSFPEWLCRMWREMYGEETAEALFECVSHNPKVALRVNTLVNSRDELISKLREAGIQCRASDKVDSAVILERGCPFERLDEAAGGGFYIQDEASQLAVKALGAREGEFIIDACAAPGGKSFGCAIEMRSIGRILSCDLHKNKLSLIEKGASRLELSIIEAAEMNAARLNESLLERADRVICDVPCSGLGVIAKKPEIRYKAQEDIERLPEIQRAIIENVSRYVRPGGVLLYSTCTLNRHENDEVVLDFLAHHPEFSLDGEMTTLFPHRDLTDGFFFARLIKAE